MEENKRISDLFERARNEAPSTSFQDVKSNFLAAGAVGATGIIAKWAATSFKFKAIIMITTLSTLTISGILIATQLNSDTQNTAIKGDVNQETVSEFIEIRSEDGVQKTIIYDQNNQVVNVTVDSSNSLKSTNPEVRLSTKEPKLLVNTVSELQSPMVSSQMTQKVVSAGDSLTMKRFKITHKTSTDELKKITSQARAAGIEFDYTARVRKNIIKKLRIDMELPSGEGMSEWHTKISGSNSFSYDFGWWEDASGKAIRFINAKEMKIGASRTD